MTRLIREHVAAINTARGSAVKLKFIPNMPGILKIKHFFEKAYGIRLHDMHKGINTNRNAAAFRIFSDSLPNIGSRNAPITGISVM